VLLSGWNVLVLHLALEGQATASGRPRVSFQVALDVLSVGSTRSDNGSYVALGALAVSVGPLAAPESCPDHPSM